MGSGGVGGRGSTGGTTGGTLGGGRGGAGGLPGTDETTEKSLEWRVVANEDQIHRFSTTLKDLSVSGDSLLVKVRFRSYSHPPYYGVSFGIALY